jgi:hypothetical protein
MYKELSCYQKFIVCALNTEKIVINKTKLKYIFFFSVKSHFPAINILIGVVSAKNELLPSAAR